MNKKALIPKTIAEIILLIISAAVLIFVLISATNMFKGTINAEICHSTVVSRGSESLIKGTIEKAVIPLNCKTEQKCLSMGGECPAGYDQVPVSNEADIKKEIAGSMYDCWWMFGEGKINFLGSDWSGKNTCLFCSLITFDSKVQEKYPVINDLNSYLAKTNIPEKNMTYSQYLSNNWDATSPSGNIADKVLTNEKYVVLFGYIDEGVIAKRIAAGTAGCISFGGMAAASGFTLGTMVPVIGNTVGAGVGFVSGLIGCYYGSSGGVNAVNYLENLFGKGYDYIVGIQLLQFTPENVKNLGCTDIASIP